MGNTLTGVPLTVSTSLSMFCACLGDPVRRMTVPGSPLSAPRDMLRAQKTQARSSARTFLGILPCSPSRLASVTTVGGRFMAASLPKVMMLTSAPTGT